MEMGKFEFQRYLNDFMVRENLRNFHICKILGIGSSTMSTWKKTTEESRLPAESSISILVKKLEDWKNAGSPKDIFESKHIVDKDLNVVAHSMSDFDKVLFYFIEERTKLESRINYMKKEITAGIVRRDKLEAAITALRALQSPENSDVEEVEEENDIEYTEKNTSVL